MVDQARTTAEQKLQQGQDMAQQQLDRGKSMVDQARTTAEQKLQQGQDMAQQQLDRGKSMVGRVQSVSEQALQRAQQEGEMQLLKAQEIGSQLQQSVTTSAEQAIQRPSYRGYSGDVETLGGDIPDDAGVTYLRSEGTNPTSFLDRLFGPKVGLLSKEPTAALQSIRSDVLEKSVPKFTAKLTIGTPAELQTAAQVDAERSARTQDLRSRFSSADPYAPVSILEQEGGVTPSFWTRSKQRLGTWFDENIKPPAQQVQQTIKTVKSTPPDVASMPTSQTSESLRTEAAQQLQQPIATAQSSKPDVELQSIIKPVNEVQAAEQLQQLKKIPQSALPDVELQPIIKSTPQPGDALQPDATVLPSTSEGIAAKANALLPQLGDALGSVAEMGAIGGALYGISVGESKISNPEVRTDVNLATNTGIALDQLSGASGEAVQAAKRLFQTGQDMQQYAARTTTSLSQGASDASETLSDAVKAATDIVKPVTQTISDAATSVSDTAQTISDTAQTVSDAAKSVSVGLENAATTAQETISTTVSQAVQGATDAASSAVSEGIAGAAAAASEIPGIGEVIGGIFALSMLGSAIYEGIKGSEETSPPENPVSLPIFQSGI